MPHDQNISIIQLIKTGEISVEVEIAHVKAKGDVNLSIQSYFQKLDYYNELTRYINEAEEELKSENDAEKANYLREKISKLHEIKADYIRNALYLADTLAKIIPNNERLHKAIVLFDAGKIREADTLLNEADLLNDQYNLIAFVTYQERKIKLLEDDL